MPSQAAWAGRALVRECYQHRWRRYMGPAIEVVCGYSDDGAALLQFGARNSPRRSGNGLEEDDAGNCPGNQRQPKALGLLLQWVYANHTWPAEWPLPEAASAEGQ